MEIYWIKSNKSIIKYKIILYEIISLVFSSSFFLGGFRCMFLIMILCQIGRQNIDEEGAT